MSQFTYSGSNKLALMPARRAIDGFSVASVYTIAELIRAHKGGAAVVMGALSPRTRNAQVELYQNGDESTCLSGGLLFIVHCGNRD